ncbi:MAG: metalloregulator ArsR/SmtB family transcription factor [Tissierellaceae bacterium]|nr:metalloregulator ArsR/SmtB family transcription factor [Tissierellaceae bacterium]
MKKTEDKILCVGNYVESNVLDDIKDQLDKETGLDNLARIYKALGDPSRLKIIYVLSKSPLCVCDIAALLDMTQSSISHHLRILRDLNLVKFKKEGKLVIYSLDDEHVLRLLEEGVEHTKH